MNYKCVCGWHTPTHTLHFRFFMCAYECVCMCFHWTKTFYTQFVQFLIIIRFSKFLFIYNFYYIISFRSKYKKCIKFFPIWMNWKIVNALCVYLFIKSCNDSFWIFSNFLTILFCCSPRLKINFIIFFHTPTQNFYFFILYFFLSLSPSLSPVLSLFFSTIVIFCILYIFFVVRMETYKKVKKIK